MRVYGRKGESSHVSIVNVGPGMVYVTSGVARPPLVDATALQLLPGDSARRVESRAIWRRIGVARTARDLRVSRVRSSAVRLRRLASGVRHLTRWIGVVPFRA